MFAARDGIGQRVGGLPRFGATLRDDGHAVFGVTPRGRRRIPLFGLRIQNRTAAADTQRQVVEDLVFEVEISDRTVLGGSLVGVVDEGDGVRQVVVLGVGCFVIVVAHENWLVENETLHQSVVRIGTCIGDGSLGHDVGEVDRTADGELLAEVAVETDAARETFHLILLDDAFLIEVACRSGHFGLRAAARSDADVVALDDTRAHDLLLPVAAAVVGEVPHLIGQAVAVGVDTPRITGRELCETVVREFLSLKHVDRIRHPGQADAHVEID